MLTGLGYEIIFVVDELVVIWCGVHSKALYRLICPKQISLKHQRDKSCFEKHFLEVMIKIFPSCDYSLGKFDISNGNKKYFILGLIEAGDF